MMPDTWPAPGQPLALLLIPLAWLLLWLLYRLKRHSNYWQQHLPAAFLPWLLQQQYGKQHKTPWILSGAAILFGGLALSAPHLPTSGHSTAVTPDPLVLVLELTPDMLASDLLPSRLHQLRSKAMAMQQAQLPGQTALVVYAGSPHTLLPLSTDPAMAEHLLQAMHPSLMPLPGRRADAAVAQALELLQQGANQRGRIALLTHDLSHAEQAGITKLLQPAQARLAIIGVGSLQGAPVPSMDTGSFDAESPLSHLQEERLQQFARQLGASYARLSSNRQDLLQSRLFVENPQGQLQASSHSTPANAGYWLLLPMLVLLAPLARKGWLFSLLLALPLLQPSQSTLAGEAARPDTTHTREHPQPVPHQLQDPLWLGIAAYQAGDYQLARDYFARLDSATAHYNRGNSLMQLGDYAAAATAYQQALAQQPDLLQARDNLALAKQLQASAQPAANTAEPHGGTIADTPTGNQEPTEKTATLHPSDQDSQYGSLDSWLQQIPDNPAALLKRKFRRELSQFAP